MTEELSTYRRAFDERLIALETGLADPDRSPALESLVLDMVRAATDEAEAAARDAVVRAQRGAEAMLSTALAQAQAAQVELDGDRAHLTALYSEIATLKEQLATAVIARQDADSARERERADVTATISELQQLADDAKRAATSGADELAAATARVDAAIRERDELAHDLHVRAADREALVAERDGLATERDALVAARDGLAADRDALTAERDRLVAERADFLRTHDAMVLQRDALAHERDDIRLDRDRQIAQLHTDLDAREKALREARDTAAAAPPAPQKATGSGTATGAPANGPERQSDRKAFTNALGVQIDGEAALLVDLSVTGAQVLSCSSLKPAKTVKMLLPSSDAPVLCRGRIVWARLEPTMPGRPIRYRAGMFFTATDQAAVQTFMARHGSHGARA